MNKILVMFLGLFFVLLNTRISNASGFNLKSIGSVDTNGQASGHWWYTANNPKFSGDALPTEAVDITIDGVKETAPTSSDGTWQYTPTTLTPGDHKVVLTSGGATISFTLTIGADNVDWEAAAKGAGGALPATGISEMTWILAIVGLSAMGWGGKMVLNVAKK